MRPCGVAVLRTAAGIFLALMLFLWAVEPALTQTPTLTLAHLNPDNDLEFDFSAVIVSGGDADTGGTTLYSTGKWGAAGSIAEGSLIFGSSDTPFTRLRNEQAQPRVRLNDSDTSLDLDDIFANSGERSASNGWAFYLLTSPTGVRHNLGNATIVGDAALRLNLSTTQATDWGNIDAGERFIIALGKANSTLPTISNLSAGSITQNSVDLNATITNSSSALVTLHYRYRAVGELAWVSAGTATTTATAATKSLGGLSPGTPYEAEVSITSAFAAASTTRETFSTLAAPSITSITVSNISDSRANITVAWTNPASQSLTVHMDVVSGSGTQHLQATPSASATTHNFPVSGLNLGTSYTVYVGFSSLPSSDSSSDRVTFTTPNANEPPRFASDRFERQVENHSPAGSAVGAPVTAEDTDPLTYSLGGADARSFDLDSSTGQIKVGAGVSLDRTVRASYTVTVTARDPAGGTATATVAVEVVFPRYVAPEGVEGVGLLERVCGSAIPGAAGIPGCPVTLVPLMPLIGLGLLLSLGVRNPMVLGGVAVGAAAATSVAISPNPLMISLLVLAALSVVIGVGWLRKV